jgi:hypothetical protein
MGRVNLLYLCDVERIHAFHLNRSAVQMKRDPLYERMAHNPADSLQAIWDYGLRKRACIVCSFILSWA